MLERLLLIWRLYIWLPPGRLVELILNYQKNPKESESDTALPDDLCEMEETPLSYLSRITHTLIDGAGAYVLRSMSASVT